MNTNPARRQPESKPQTLAARVNWLIDHAHPAGRGPYSNVEIAALIYKATGEHISHTTIWKLRNGQSTNPQIRMIHALARTFGVPTAYFFDDFNDQQAEQVTEQAELLAIIRDAGITINELRTFASLTREGRRAIVEALDLIDADAVQRNKRDDDHEQAWRSPRQNSR